MTVQHRHFNNQPTIIVGQGLAGSLLAWSLMQKNAPIHIYSDGKISASRVAAGIINPVTGQRFVLADKTPEMLTYAASFYQNIEQKLHIKCFFSMPMMRLFNSQKEQENCAKRLKNHRYHPFLHETDIPTQIRADLSGIKQTHTAWLDTNVLLDALHAYFKTKKVLSDTSFRKTMHTEMPSNIIYCEGYNMINNPLFSWLPLQPAHGEIITCESQQTLPDYIINQSRWLLPISKHTCRIGATYDTDILRPQLKEDSKEKLLHFATQLFTKKISFKVIQHQAGIRPTTKDKQPFIGFHPKHPHIAIFNGFGSRGSLLIPWYSQAFTQTLLQQKNIPAESNINRYTSTASPSNF